ncbi:hypothetical protein BZZ01_13230 [Nostocales cyanobacterium HT-58-2]|nr:hypothetical protein BZZ01_13230 [Nostocales cyanobacterium HT-58-2]
MTQDGIVTNSEEKIIGQLVVGNRIIKIGSEHGATVNIATKEEKPTLRSRSIPLILQQPLDTPLDRQELVQEAIAALQAGQSVEFYSPSGFGKTVLLRSLAHDNRAKLLFPGGVISLSPVHPNVGDLLQSIWDTFYESDIPYKPTRYQIEQQTQEKQALIVLDESGLIQDELEELMNATGKCTFLVASLRSRLKKRGRSIALAGLSMSDALALVERELQRSVQREELAAAKSLCHILNGHPMHIQIAVASILEERRSLAQLVSQLSTSAPGNSLIQQIVTSLSTSERAILDILTILGDIGLESEQVSDITQLSDTFSALEKLRRHHLVQLDGSRYQVNRTVLEVLPPEWQLSASLEKAIAYFVHWAERHQQQPTILLSEIDAIAQIIEVAVKDSRWKDVLRLTKIVEGSLALSKRWGLWGQVLQRGLQASQAERNQADLAWALHQLGTRALCLEEYSTAENYLTQAIQLRQSLGDDRGVAATRNNLSLLKDSSSSPNQTHQHKNFTNSVKEDITTQLSSTEYPLTRMNLVLSENASHSGKSFYKNALLSPTGIITTGILASGGLLAWFNWHRFIPSPPATSTTTPTTTAKPSPVPKLKPKQQAIPSPTIDVPPAVTLPLSPLPAVTPKVNPPIKPNIENQQPIVPKRDKSKREPAPAPATTAAPELIQPTPDVTIVPTPTSETTPTPETSTPSQTPSLELNQPSVEPTPTPTFSPIPPPVPTPKVEAIPTPAVTSTPMAQPINSTIEQKTEYRTQNTQ